MGDASRMCNFGCCMSCRGPLLPGDVMLVNRECVRVYLINAQFFALQAEHLPASQFAGFIEMSHVIPYAQRHSAIQFAWSRVEESPVDSGAFNVPPRGTIRFSTLDDSNSALFTNKRLPKSDYRARWDPPTELQPMQRLLKHVSKLAGDRPGPSIDLNLMYPCCSHCNDIMDAEARIGWMCIQGLVPSKAVSVYGKKGDSVRVRPDRSVDNFHSAELGALVAYYLHRCLLNFDEADVDYSGMHVSVRKVFVTLCFVILNIVAVWLERRSPVIKKDKPKGRHIHDGVLNLLTGHCLYLLFCLEKYTVGVDFSRFQLFYMLELVDAPKEIWDQNDTTLYAPLFAAIDSGEIRDVSLMISSVADRLVDLYQFPVRYVCKRMLGLRPKAFSVNKKAEWDAIVAYFVSYAEAGQLQTRHDYCRQFSPKRIDQDISRFVRNVGIFPVLWPLMRSLVVEDERYRQLVYRWISFERDIECEALIEHNQALTSLSRAYHTLQKREDNALLLFNLCFLLRPHELYGDITAAEAMEQASVAGLPDLRKRARGAPFCSIWKATIRHARLNCLGPSWFDRPAPNAPLASLFSSLRLSDAPLFSHHGFGDAPLGVAIPASAATPDSTPVGYPLGSPLRRQGERREPCAAPAPLVRFVVPPPEEVVPARD